MRRLFGWESKLDDFLQRNQYRPFQYGEWDCGLFVAGAIEVMTGIDLALPFRGLYESRKQALERMKGFCGVPSLKRVAGLVASKNGMPEVAVNEAWRGDLVLLKQRGLGLVALNGREILRPANQGLYRFPLEDALTAWRV